MLFTCIYYFDLDPLRSEFYACLIVFGAAQLQCPYMSTYYRCQLHTDAVANLKNIHYGTV
jgi:hypothetical protein